VDPAIQTLKKAMFRRVVGDKDRDWAANLQTTVAGINGQEHSSLKGRTPDQVGDDPVLRFEMRRNAADAAFHNSALIHDRDDRIQASGAFRPALLLREHQRSYQPRFSDQVHDVASVHVGIVKDAEGNVFQARHVRPVPLGSADATHTEGMHGGNALIERKNLEALAPFKDRVVAHVGAGKWIHEMAAYMRSIGMQPLLKGALNYKKAVVSFGLHVDDRGRVTNPAYVAPAAPAAPALAPAVVAAARRRLGVKTAPAAPVAPALAPAVARRRLVSKTTV
jgi:hypothetical protein